MKPTPGDIRCIAFGHITRLAIWKLRPTWKKSLATLEKLDLVRVTMDSIANVDDVKARIEERSTPELPPLVGLFRAHNQERLDAVTF